MPALEAEARLLRETFGYDARVLSRDELFQTAACDHEAHGAMWEADGVAVHAAKLAFEYLRVDAVPEWVRRIAISCAVAFTTWAGISVILFRGGVRRPAVEVGPEANAAA